MKTARRFKPDSKWYIGVFYFVNGVLVLFSAMVLRTRFYLLFLVLVLLAVVLVNITFACRTRNLAYLAPALNYLLITVMIWSRVWGAAGAGERLHLPLAAAYAVNLAAFLVLGCQRKLKWRREEVLELAALPMAGSANGFTARPFPAGRTDATAGELDTFARFLFRRLVAVPYVEKERLVLVLARRPLDHVLGLRRRRDRDTWVSFAFDGDVTVSLVRSDYRNYADEYTFDLLCRSLGRLFIEFLDLHRGGRGQEIVARLDSLRLPPFTGGLVGF